MDELPKAGDLSSFRKIETTAMTPGPRGVFAGKIGDENKRESVSRPSSSSNMFSMLSQGPKEAEPQRKLLVRGPRSKPSAKDVTAKSESKAVGPVTHLRFSANRRGGDIRSKGKWIVLVHRKVNALLNKLTMEKFDSISDQIVAWVNKSENENDGMTLVCVTRLIFEHALDGAIWSEMYARLCRKVMERIIPTVCDEDIRSTDGKPITGGQLFRKYLLNRCQEEFESDWLMEQAAAASKATEDQVVKEAAQRSGSTKTALYSNEYSAAQKAQRRGSALMRFLGELFKLQMLTERIMHECVKRLLGNLDTPKEENLERCCVLMKTVGFMIDTPRAAKHMGVYFARITELRNSPFVSLRIRFLLQDVIELCERKWVDRTMTIAQIHENVQVRPPPNAGHLSNFAKINKIMATTFGLSNIFSGKKGGESKGESASSTSLSSDMFSMLTQGTEPEGESKDPEPERKQLVPAPQSRPSTDNVATGKAKFSIEMIKEQAAQKAIEDAIELFATRHFNEAESYFSTLPPVHHSRLVEKLTAHAVEAKESQVQSLVECYARVVDKKLCSPAAFEQGFMPMAKIIDDVKIDVPKAFTYFVTVVKSAGLDKEREARLAAMTTDATKFLDADVPDPRISVLFKLPLMVAFIIGLVSIGALFSGI